MSYDNNNNSWQQSWDQGQSDALSGYKTPGGKRPGESDTSYQTRVQAFDSTKASQDSGSKSDK
jgi:hypothetical protein